MNLYTSSSDCGFFSLEVVIPVFIRKLVIVDGALNDLKSLTNVAHSVACAYNYQWNYLMEVEPLLHRMP
jgi:hypothetical protein